MKKRNDTINKKKKRKCIISKTFIIYVKTDLVLIMTMELHSIEITLK